MKIYPYLETNVSFVLNKAKIQFLEFIAYRNSYIYPLSYKNFNMFSYTNRTSNIFLLVFIISLFSSGNLIAQDSKTTQVKGKDFWQSVRFGGSLGLNFGNNRFTGIIAPSAIYDFSEIVSAGIGLSGAYTKQNNFTATSVGGSLLTMVNPVRFLQFSAEFQELNINRNLELDCGNSREQYWVPALFLGAGFSSGNVVTGLRYDVLHDENKSFYSSALMPFVSIYF
jgi:hypothetical protein